MRRPWNCWTHAEKGDEPLGTHPDNGKPIFLKKGRFGPYIQLGTADDSEKPKKRFPTEGDGSGRGDIWKRRSGCSRSPVASGRTRRSNEPVVASNGRYGPYIQCGTETRSLPDGTSPLEVTLEQAIDLLKQPKTRGRGSATPREPLKEFEESPVTGEPVKLLAGRYGPYVTDGQTNASLPKGTAAGGGHLRTGHSPVGGARRQGSRAQEGCQKEGRQESCQEKVHG